MPEEHLWGPRDYFKSTYYTEHTAEFVSEIGYHGCPSLSSLKRFIDEQAPVARRRTIRSGFFTPRIGRAIPTASS